MVLDLAIQDGLRDGGIVHLRVAVTAEANQIHNGIGSELVTEFQRHAASAYHRVRIFAIHMEDRNRKPLGEIRREAAGIGIAWIRGEAEQIVDDDVDGSADGIAAQVGEVQGLRGNPLSREGGVAMHQEWAALSPCHRVPGESAWRGARPEPRDQLPPGGWGWKPGESAPGARSLLCTRRLRRCDISRRRRQARCADRRPRSRRTPPPEDGSRC